MARGFSDTGRESIVEALEARWLFAKQVFFQDFDNPGDRWDNHGNAGNPLLNPFVKPGGAAEGAKRKDVGTECPNALDGRMLRGNWTSGFEDPCTDQTSPDGVDRLQARYTNIAIGTVSRGVRDEIFLQHWVWFDAGVEAFPGDGVRPRDNIKFVQFDGGNDGGDFDWYINLDTGNFDGFSLKNNNQRNPKVGGADPPGANFSESPGADALIGDLAPADWFRGRWHLVQVHMKLNTADNVSDGTFRFWLDGINVLDHSNVDLRDETSDTFRQVLPLSMHGGNESPPDAAGLGFGWQLDKVELWDGLPSAPAVQVAEFLQEAAPHRIAFTFDQNVRASLGAADLLVERVGPGGGPVTVDDPNYDLTNNVATFAFDGVIPSGHYRATLHAPGVTNITGTPMSGSFVHSFTFLMGDANNDGRIDSDDYFRIDSGFLAQPQDPLYSQGDFNYDNLINSDDYFLIDSAFLGQGAPLAGDPPTAGALAADVVASTVPAEPQQKAVRKQPVRPIFSDEPVSVLGPTRRAIVTRRR